MPKVTEEIRGRTWLYICRLKVELQDSLSHSSDTLDVRLGFSLCQEEVEFVQKRKVVVAKTLSQVLQLEEDLHEDEVGKHGHWPGLRVALGSWSPNSMFYWPPYPSQLQGDYCTTWISVFAPTAKVLAPNQGP